MPASRPFRWLLFGRVVSDIGDQVLLVAFAIAIVREGGSPTDVGLVLAARTVTSVVFLPIGGVVADRFDRRAVAASAEALRAVTQVVSGVLLLHGGAIVLPLALTQLLYGVGKGLFEPALTGLVPATVPAEELQRANGVLGFFRNASWLVGPALGAIVVAVLSPAWAVLADGLTFAASAVTLALLPHSRRTPAPERGPGFFAELGSGWRAFISRTWLWVLVVDFAVFQATVIAPLFVLGPLVSDQHLGGPSAWGALLAGLGVGGIAGSSAAALVRVRRPLLSGCVLFLLDVPALLLLASHAPLAAIVVGTFLAGFGGGAFGVLWTTALQRHVPDDVLSRVSAWDWLGSTISLPLGYVLVGPLASAVGASELLYASAAVVVVSTAVTLAVPSVRRMRDRPDDDGGNAMQELSPA